MTNANDPRNPSNHPQLANAELEAKKVFREVKAEKVWMDHEYRQKAFYLNRDRLKAERLAREAEDRLKVRK